MSRTNLRDKLNIIPRSLNLSNILNNLLNKNRFFYFVGFLLLKILFITQCGFVKLYYYFVLITINLPEGNLCDLARVIRMLLSPLRRGKRGTQHYNALHAIPPALYARLQSRR